jgi:very-short-patch-repair endonuclease
MRLRGWSGGKQAARESRKTLSSPELRLWLELRKEPGGHYFRRQHRAGPYRLDFYCAKAKLCIEVDSEAHERGDRPERDARRDAWLEERGVATLRIAAVDVMRNLEGVLQHILATIAARG